MTKTTVTLIALALLIAGCATSTPAAPTPQIIYVTSAPATPFIPPILLATPEAQPTAIPPVPTPVQAGTSWLTYLTWSGGAFTDLKDVMAIGADGDFFTAARQGAPMAASQLAWLNSHPPLACYETLHSTHVRQLTQIQASFDAINDFDLEAGLEHLEDSQATSGLWSVLIDSVDCAP